MRWFVEVSSVGKAAEKQRYCVEAESWQRALQAARELRSDPGPMTGFSIELLDDGFSAIDPIKRQRYSIRKAPADEPLTRPSQPPPVEKPGDRKSTRPPAAEKSKSARPPAVAEKPAEPVASAPPPAVEPTAAATPSRPPPSRSSRPPAPDLNLSPKNKTKTGAGATPAPPQAAPVAAPAANTPPRDSAPPPSTGAQAVAPVIVAPVASAPATLDILAKREQEPGPDGPLTYRECAYFIDGTPTRAEAEKLLRQQLDGIRTAIAGAKPGKLVNLALFNVRFTGRPPKLPLVTLTWKDWREEPVVSFPEGPVAAPVAAVATAAQASPPAAERSSIAAAALLSTATIRMSPADVPAPETPSLSTATARMFIDPPAAAADLVPATPAVVVAPAPAIVVPAAVAAPLPQPSVTAPSQPVPSAPVQTVSVPPAPTMDAAPVSAPPESSAPPTTRGSGFPGAPISTRTPSAKRLRGDELIADLFEAMHDLQFLRDAIEGADFCLTLALEKMPAHGGIVHLYDIDRRQFVITCAGGKGGESLLSQRSAENDPILFPTMRKRRALVLSDATKSEAARVTPRYATLGGAKSLMVAPVALGGRFLGAIELMNPTDSIPFTDDDGHALSYIAEQLAGFVGQRGIILEREKPQDPSVPMAAKSTRSLRAR